MRQRPRPPPQQAPPAQENAPAVPPPQPDGHPDDGLAIEPAPAADVAPTRGSILAAFAPKTQPQQAPPPAPAPQARPAPPAPWVSGPQARPPPPPGLHPTARSWG